MYGDALTTKERIKSRLTIEVATWDDFFDNLILSVTARIEQMCGRRFVEAEFANEIHDGSDLFGSIRTTLIVKNAPLQAVASIQFNAGTQATPSWTDFDADEYIVDYDAGVIHFPNGIPRGLRNIRVTYTGGYSGHAIGISAFWHFNSVPTGAVDGTNLTFMLPENADQVVVYPDGIRESAANVTFFPDTNTFTLAADRAPVSTIAVDYLASSTTDTGDVTLPDDLVEVAERAVVKLFKKRDSEGRAAETFQESSITWDNRSGEEKDVFTAADRATIRNYRRGYNL